MISWPYNYHAHTPFGDGHSSPIDYALAADAGRMKSFGISEHAPLGSDIDWTMPLQQMQEYRAQLTELQVTWSDRIDIYSGLEVDWWPARSHCFNDIEPGSWDYLIGSVHFVTTPSGTLVVDDSPLILEAGVREVFAGDIRLACEAFFGEEVNAAGAGRFDILGHFDLIKKYNKNNRYFDSSEPWYREMASAVVDAAARSGIIVEVNTAGLDKPVGETYPAPWLIERCVRSGVRLTLSSDAHRAEDMQRHFDTVLPELYQLGVRELWRLARDGWGAVSLAVLAT